MNSELQIISKVELSKTTGIGIKVIDRLVAEGKLKMHNGHVLATESRRIREQIRQYSTLNDFIERIKPESSLYTRKNEDKVQIFFFLNPEIPDELLVSEQSVDINYDSYSKYHVDTSLVTSRVIEIITVWLKGFKRKREEKIDILLDALSKRYPVFVLQIKILFGSIGHNHNNVSGVLAVADALQAVTKKDVPFWTEKELRMYSKILERYLKPSWAIWNMLQLQLQNAGYLKSVRLIQIEQYQKQVKHTDEAYALYDFALLMQYCLSKESIEKNDLLKKALNDMRYACLWLYIAMHFVSAWRTDDYCRIIAPDIQLTPDEIIELFESGNEEVFRRVTDITIYSIKQLERGPHKTQTSKSPSLKVYVAESLKPALGLIIAVLNTHATAGKPLIPNVYNTKKNIRDFFGQEISTLLQGRPFSNRRANKALMTTVMLSADEDCAVASGYVLAGLLRSHKSSYYDIPASTKYYLKSIETENLSTEFVVEQLFQRGICGFAVQALLELVYDENGMQELTFQETTEIISESNITPLQAENIIVQKHAAESKAKELIAMMRKQHMTIGELLTKIAVGHGKLYAGGYCFARAVCGKCLRSDRMRCNHCDFEVVTTELIQQLLTEREIISSRLNAGESEIATMRDKALIERVNADLMEICTTADMFSTESKADVIAKMIERRTLCLQ